MNLAFPGGNTIRDLVVHSQQAMQSGTIVLFASRILETRTSLTDQVIWFLWQLVTLYLQPFVGRCCFLHLNLREMKLFQAASSLIAIKLHAPTGLIFNGKNIKFLMQFLTRFDRICDHIAWHVAFSCVKSS